MKRSILALMTMMPMLATQVYGHPEGLDAQGCHQNRKTGEYHCHWSPPIRPPISPPVRPAPSPPAPPSRVKGDTTPPVITVSASLTRLPPPNGALVAVMVSGTILDELNGSGVEPDSAVYTVIDEYDQHQPIGNMTLTDGKYAFTVHLRASRNGDDCDGRHYTIMVSATDYARNMRTESALVTVSRQ